jgi:hypothetical protein
MMTKKQQTETCKVILNKYNLGDYLTRSEAIFMGNIFKNHPNWDKKRKMGIKKIQIDKDDFGHRCFYLVFVDGTRDSISYITSIKGKCNTHKEKLIKACRTAIYPEIVKFRNTVNFGLDVCQFSNKILTKENTHIDHYDLTFNQMFNLWINDKNIKDIKIKKVGQSFVFENSEVENDFVDFHNKNCKLRAILDKVNLTIK